MTAPDNNSIATTAVFLGPTLDHCTAKQLLPATYFPPVCLGDLYRLLPEPVETIVLIDGLFDGTTPVWHREILAQLEAGRQVIGASSMGALRAVELEPYGMLGCGDIYRWYKEGIIDGDDEVALLHGTRELDYVKLSEPLVNVRWNLIRAVADGVLDDVASSRLLQHAKSLYFGDRTIQNLLTNSGIGEDQKLALDHWWKQHYVDLKRKDAIAALKFTSNLGS